VTMPNTAIMAATRVNSGRRSSSCQIAFNTNPNRAARDRTTGMGGIIDVARSRKCKREQRRMPNHIEFVASSAAPRISGTEAHDEQGADKPGNRPRRADARHAGGLPISDPATPPKALTTKIIETMPCVIRLETDTDEKQSETVAQQMRGGLHAAGGRGSPATILPPRRPGHS